VSRPRSSMLTAREAEIMDVIWTLGAATAEQVRAGLPGAEKPHESSVRTILRGLEAKGLVDHELRGKAFVYRGKIARLRAQKGAIRDLLTRFFAGSAHDLILRLIEDEQLTSGELAEIRESTKRTGASRTPKKGSLS
jgi:BlaI family transcriptional regulator, penicillinase repressor